LATRWPTTKNALERVGAFFGNEQINLQDYRLRREAFRAVFFAGLRFVVLFAAFFFAIVVKLFLLTLLESTFRFLIYGK